MVSKYCSHFWFILSENLWVLKCIPVQVIQQYFILINNRLYPVVRDLTEPACSLIFQSLHLDFLFFIIKMLFLLCKVKFNYFKCRFVDRIWSLYLWAPAYSPVVRTVRIHLWGVEGRGRWIRVWIKMIVGKQPGAQVTEGQLFLMC